MKKSIRENIQQVNAKDLARYAKALGHPTRLEILTLLSKQSCCYTGDLVNNLPFAQSTISQHLKELKDAGLICGEINPPKIRYCIDTKNWETAKRLFEGLFNEKIVERK